MIHTLGLGDVSQVVEHHRRRHPVEDRHDLDDLSGRCVDLNVPSEFVDPFRERLDHLRRRRPGRREVEADAARALLMHAFQLGTRTVSLTTTTARACGPNVATASRLSIHSRLKPTTLLAIITSSETKVRSWH